MRVGVWGMSRSGSDVRQQVLRPLRKVVDAVESKRVEKARQAARVEQLEKQLAKTRKQLRDTRTQVRQMRGKITEAQYDLPEAVTDVISAVQTERLTFLKPNQLYDLATIMSDIEQRGVPGLVLEAGTARGGSAIVLAKAKASERPMRVYDVFGLIPPPTEQDGADVHKRYAKIVNGEAKGTKDDIYYGYRDDLLAEVSASFTRHGVPPAEHNVELVKGLFQDTVVIDEPVAFAHLDGDWYESTMTCLERIAPHVSPGGRMVLDDYYNWSGCRQAVQDYFKGRTEFTLEPRAKMHVIRK